jgi:branched-chain amino acid transport system permease protein
MNRQFLGLLAGGVIMALVPLVVHQGYAISILTSIFLWGYLSVCWNILGGMTGQLSFGHAVFFGVGAYASAALFIHYGLHPLLGGLIGIALACVLALAIGYVSARYNLVHLHFALVTTAVGQIVLFLTMGWDFLGGSIGLSLPFKAKPEQLFFRNPAIYYWIFLGMTVAVLGLTLFIRQRRMGLYFLCIRESEPAAAGAGINIMRQKLLAMVISAALTAAGGVVYAHYIRYLDPDSIFGWQVSLQMVIPAMLGGTQAVLGPVIGAAIFVTLSEFTRSLVDFAGAPLIIVGVVLVPVVLFLPNGVLPSAIKLVARRRKAALRRRIVTEGTAPARPRPAPVITKPRDTQDVLLRVKSLSRRFGGVQAVNNVSLQCGRNERLAIIGPNGAGKSTLFALLGGFVAPNTGEIWFDGTRIDGMPANQVCTLGLARTFQTAQPFKELTVQENVLASSFLHAVSHAEALAEARKVLVLFDLAAHADERSADLNIIDQKRLELARAWATKPRLILLDEVGAGLTNLELEQLADTLAQLNAEHGTAIVFIEHMMSMVSRLADRVIVLHHGEILAQGSMAEVTANPVVIEAYLGESAIVA